MPRQRRNINRQNAVLDGANVPAEPTDYSAMSTEALRLMLGEHHLQQTGNRRELISRLQQNEQQRPPASQSACAPSNSSIATGVPHAELAALIASIVDERMNHQVIQDGGASNASAQRLCLNHTVQKDSREVLGTSFRFGPTSEILENIQYGGSSVVKTDSQRTRFISREA